MENLKNLDQEIKELLAMGMPLSVAKKLIATPTPHVNPQSLMC